MRASIIIVSYNSRFDLPMCLDAVINTVIDNDEIIVVDNGSQDGSAEFVSTMYPQVRLIENSNNGYAGGNNRGVRESRGEYVVFLNPDTIMQPGALDALLKPFEHHPTIGMTTACLVYRDHPQVINTCGNTMHYTGLTYCRGANQPVAQHRDDCDVDAISGAAFAMRREVFDHLGGFDESFFMYVEDTDLSLRARLSGYSCWYVASAVVFHDYAMAYSPMKAFYIDRNRYLMLLKNLQPTTLLRLLPGLILGEIVTWGYLLLRGPRYWGVKWRVYRSLWKQRHAFRHGFRQRSHCDRAIIRGLTHRLAFGQIANPWLALIAGALFHLPFRLARLTMGGGR